jgi:hypothetical protein
LGIQSAREEWRVFVPDAIDSRIVELQKRIKDMPRPDTGMTDAVVLSNAITRSALEISLALARIEKKLEKRA